MKHYIDKELKKYFEMELEKEMFNQNVRFLGENKTNISIESFNNDYDRGETSIGADVCFSIVNKIKLPIYLTYLYDKDEIKDKIRKEVLLFKQLYKSFLEKELSKLNDDIND